MYPSTCESTVSGAVVAVRHGHHFHAVQDVAAGVEAVVLVPRQVDAHRHRLEGRVAARRAHLVLHLLALLPVPAEQLAPGGAAPRSEQSVQKAGVMKASNDGRLSTRMVPRRSLMTPRSARRRTSFTKFATLLAAYSSPRVICSRYSWMASATMPGDHGQAQPQEAALEVAARAWSARASEASTSNPAGLRSCATSKRSQQRDRGRSAATPVSTTCSGRPDSTPSAGAVLRREPGEEAREQAVAHVRAHGEEREGHRARARPPATPPAGPPGR